MQTTRAISDVSVSDLSDTLGITSQQVRERASEIYGFITLSDTIRERNPIAVMFASILAAARESGYSKDWVPITIQGLEKEAEKLGVSKNEIAELYGFIRPAFSITPKLRYADEAFEIFSTQAYGLELSESVLKRARELYDLSTNNKKIVSNNNKGYLPFACVYRACKESAYPYSASDIVKTATKAGIEMDEALLLTVCHRVANALRLSPIYTDPGIFVSRFVKALELEKDNEELLETAANQILNDLRKVKNGINVGAPMSVASAAIWLGSIAVNISVGYPPLQRLAIRRVTGTTEPIMKKVAIDIEAKTGTNFLSILERLRSD